MRDLEAPSWRTTVQSLASRGLLKLLYSPRLLLPQSHLLPGLLPRVVPYSLPFSIFPTLTNLYCVLPLPLLSRFSRVQLCATPETAVHQVPLSLGFSRQEHWCGLPFPSPMYESEMWKSSHPVVSDSLWPRGLQPTRLLHPWDFPGKSTGVGCHHLLCQIYLRYCK